MLSIAWHTLRTRKGAFAGAFLALCCAAALITACGVILETGLRGRIHPERYAGTPVVVAADQNVHWTETKKDKTKTKTKPLTERAWLDARVGDRLHGMRTVGEVTFTAAPGVLGHGWGSAALAPFTLAEGRIPRAANEVVGDASFRIGGFGPYRVVGVTAQRLNRERTVFFTDEQARRLAGHAGQVTAFGVFGAGRSTVEKALAGTAKAYTGDDRGTLEFRDAAGARVKLVSMGGALGGTSLLVAILVVVGTFALSIQQRQRELALLRAVAATPRQVRRMIGGEALLVGFAAGLTGAAAGLGLAFWLRSLFVAYRAMPVNLGLVVSPFPMAAALLATLFAGWSAARLSARRTVRIRPVEALGEAAIEPGLSRVRVLAGLVVAAAYAVLLVVLGSLDIEAAATPITFLTVIVAATAVALLGPVIARAVTFMLRFPGVTGGLAGANLRSGFRRLGSVLTPLTLAVAMSGTILFTQTTTERAATEQARTGTLAGHVLTGRASDALRRTPGVRTVTEMLPTTVRGGRGRYSAQGVTVAGLDQTIDPGVSAGSLRDLGPATMAVSRTAAGHLHRGLGDTVGLTLGDGTPVRLRIGAVYERGLGFGDLLLPYDLVAAHVDDQARGRVLVAAVPGTALPTTSAAIDRRPDSAEVNLVVMGLIIAFTAIAIVNTLAMATAGRTGEFVVLRLAGTTRRQVRTMLRWETLAVAVTGIILGTLVMAGTLTAYAHGMTGGPPSVPPLIYVVVVALAAALAYAATAVPGRIALAAPATARE